MPPAVYGARSKSTRKRQTSESSCWTPLRTVYFDRETGLLTRRDVVYGKTPVQHHYEDYRDVDGIRLPFVLRSEGPVRVITRLTEVKHNVPIDDAKFRSPTN